MYRERQSTIPGAVRWRTVGTGGITAILPDGCMDIIVTPTGVIVAGPDEIAMRLVTPPSAQYDGIRFPPGMLPQLLGISAHELVGARVDLADVLPRSRRATEAEPEAIAADLLDGVVLDARISRVASELAAGASVRALANDSGLGERGLHRLATRSFGYGPKTLSRIQRFQGALPAIRRGAPLSVVAAGAGYSDQAHLSRDVRALAGCTPGELRLTS